MQAHGLTPTKHERTIISECKGEGLDKCMHLGSVPSQPCIRVAVYHEVSPLACRLRTAARPPLRMLQLLNNF